MRKRYFWQDTFRSGGNTVVVYYDNGLLVPTVYLADGRRVYPPAVAASLFIGRTALDQRRWEMGLIAGALGSANHAATAGPVLDPAFQKTHPVLFAMMTVEEEEGVKRTPSSLIIFAESGEFRACLTEKDHNLKLWRSSATFAGLLKSLETALASGNADWRRGFDPGGNGKPQKRKK